MRALTWHGKHNVQVDTVPDPKIVNPRDAIIKITATAISMRIMRLVVEGVFRA